MSKVEVKKKDSSANTQQPKSAKKSNTAKKKKKQWMREKFRKNKPPPKEKHKAKPQQTAPPTSAQQFSANWKTLQEMLKISETEKKQPQHQNGSLQYKAAKEDLSKNFSENAKTDSRRRNHRRINRDKTVATTSGSKNSQTNVKVPIIPEKNQSVASKRKKESGKSNSDQAAKKKKQSVGEDRKPTEDDLWFDDVDPDDIEAAMGAEAAELMRKKQGIEKNKKAECALVKEKAFDGLTRAVAIDCEMVGVGPNGEDSILARVSLVNQFGKCIYDKHVKPTERVTDYRTAVSGIRPKDIKDGEDLKTVQREVAEILRGRIVVGHAIHNDLKILLLDHPKKKIRDTQKYKPFRKTVKSSRPSLKLLCAEILNVNVQQGEHSSVQDAQATMRLYTLVKKQWEAEIKANKKKDDDSEKTRKRQPRCPVNKDGNLTGL